MLEQVALDTLVEPHLVGVGPIPRLRSTVWRFSTREFFYVAFHQRIPLTQTQSDARTCWNFFLFFGWMEIMSNVDAFHVFHDCNDMRGEYSPTPFAKRHSLLRWKHQTVLSYVNHHLVFVTADRQI